MQSRPKKGTEEKDAGFPLTTCGNDREGPAGMTEGTLIRPAPGGKGAKNACVVMSHRVDFPPLSQTYRLQRMTHALTQQEDPPMFSRATQTETPRLLSSLPAGSRGGADPRTDKVSRAASFLSLPAANHVLWGGGGG